MNSEPGGVVLVTLCLNEMEWLAKNYVQHCDWPGLRAWIFVEGADAIYTRTNPEMVSPDGLSTDGTTEFLAALQARDDRVRHVRAGMANGAKVGIAADQYKCILRNAYLAKIEELNLSPTYIVTIDGDEFWSRYSQAIVPDYMHHSAKIDGLVVRHREIWNPVRGAIQLVATTFDREAIGGFFDTWYCRIWRWYHGMRYKRDHNTPSFGSRTLDTAWKILISSESLPTGYPQYVHMAFASSLRTRAAKHRYYEARGEGQEGGAVGLRRQMYVDTRRAWEDGKMSGLPWGARIIPYDGPIPEVFR